MAETLVETKICDACGADVRPGSLFCYNCGGAVSLDLPVSEKNNKKDGGNSSDNNSLKTTQLKKKSIEDAAERPIAKPTVGELLEEIEAKPTDYLINKPIDKPVDKPIDGPSIQEEAKLKSAANMRRKTKTIQKKTVEVVWEEPENAPNKWFPIFAVLLILFVVAIFYLAMYLK